MLVHLTDVSNISGYTVSTNVSSLLSFNFADRLLQWFYQHGRHDLPWQHPRDAYRVWLSEIMLQQTQVATVIPYFNRFIDAFPDISSLASANQDEVLHLWSGLGYYARARNLHKAAQIILQDYNGEFPQQQDKLEQLPGIGRSTAAAIIAQAFDIPAVILDGNAKRVHARFTVNTGWPGKKNVLDDLWRQAEAVTPDQQAADFTQAIMDLGSTVCTRTKPQCAACPVAIECQAFVQQKTTVCPGKKPVKRLPTKYTRMLIIQNPDQHVLLLKRPPTGIWGGLWSLPEIRVNDESEIELSSICEQQFGIQISQAVQLDTLHHSFSHYHLQIEPLVIRANNPANLVLESAEWLWYNTRNPEDIGLPKPVTQLLQQLYSN